MNQKASHSSETKRPTNKQDDAILYVGIDFGTSHTCISASNGTRETISPSLDTGVGFNFFPAPRHALTWAVDVGWLFEDRQFDSQLKMGAVTADLRTGLEYWYHDMLALRTGLNAKDFTFGAGLRYKQVGVDYAAQLHRFFASDDPDFPDDQDLDATHIVSLGVNW